MLWHLGVSFCYNSSMANKVYESTTITTIDGKDIYITPLKIYYLRKFMESFEQLSKAETEDDKLNVLIECVSYAMEQYCTELATVEAVEDSLDLEALYIIIEIAGGISFKGDPEEGKIKEQEDSSWDKLDLVRLESKAFLLGIWKDYHELETSISMPELVAILEAKNEIDHADKKFLAAIQGVDLDKETGADRQDEWTAMKERVFGKTKTDPNDVTSLQGKKAQDAGFGIGMGLNYERI